MRVRAVTCWAIATVVGAACGGGGPATKQPLNGTRAGRGTTVGAAPDVRAATTTWTPPTDAQIPHDSLGASIRRGLALIDHTHDSLPRFAPGNVNCTSCHIDAGRAMDAVPLTRAHARYPRYMERNGAIVTLADRVNYCITRSLSGIPLPDDSREMKDILVYLAFISRGVPVGPTTVGVSGLSAMPDSIVGNATRGATVYQTSCASCHGANGEGNPSIAPGIPAVWGVRSYSIGASMAREERAASFIWHNMPYGNPKSLTPQQAFDVSAYVNSQLRPDMPGKENDWPGGGAPKDVPYDTKSGHRAHAPPAKLAPRSNAADAIVRPAHSVRGTLAP